MIYLFIYFRVFISGDEKKELQGRKVHDFEKPIPGCTGKMVNLAFLFFCYFLAYQVVAL